MHTHAKTNRCCHGKDRQKERTIVSNQPHSSQIPLLSYFMEYYIPKIFSSRLSSKIFLHRRSKQRQETMIHITFCSDLQTWRHFFYLKWKMYWSLHGFGGVWGSCVHYLLFRHDKEENNWKEQRNTYIKQNRDKWGKRIGPSMASVSLNQLKVYGWFSLSLSLPVLLWEGATAAFLDTFLINWSPSEEGLVWLWNEPAVEEDIWSSFTEVWIGWVYSEVDWELSQRQIPEGHN